MEYCIISFTVANSKRNATNRNSNRRLSKITNMHWFETFRQIYEIVS